MSIYDALKPPQEGDYPEWFKFPDHGNQIEGVIVDTRLVQPKGPGEEPYPVLQIQLADGTQRSVGCGATSLYRQVYNLRPEVGGHVRITFQGFQGQAKIFQVDYTPGTGAAPAPAAPQQQAPAPAPAAPAPQGFAPQGAPAQPWGQPAPAPAAPTPPWGQ